VAAREYSMPPGSRGGLADVGRAAIVYDGCDSGASDGEPRHETCPWAQGARPSHGCHLHDDAAGDRR
jgi:hypothetical protein